MLPALCVSCIIVDSLSVDLGAVCHRGWANNERIIVQVGCCSSPRSPNLYTNSLPPQCRTKTKVSSHCDWRILRYSKPSVQVTVWFDCDLFGKVEKILFSSLPPPLLEVPCRDRCPWWRLPPLLPLPTSWSDQLVAFVRDQQFACVPSPVTLSVQQASLPIHWKALPASRLPHCAKWPYRRCVAMRPTCVLRIERLTRFCAAGLEAGRVRWQRRMFLRTSEEKLCWAGPPPISGRLSTRLPLHQCPATVVRLHTCVCRFCE